MNKKSIIVDLQCVDLQCAIFWITCRFIVHVDLQCMLIYSAITKISVELKNGDLCVRVWGCWIHEIHGAELQWVKSSPLGIIPHDSKSSGIVLWME